MTERDLALLVVAVWVTYGIYDLRRYRKTGKLTSDEESLRKLSIRALMLRLGFLITLLLIVAWALYTVFFD